MGQELVNFYDNCSLCPNNCLVNRNNGKMGRCGQTSDMKIAWSGLHKGEEPPVSGKEGSGMVFFCGCPLHCQYCQNYQISQKDGAGIIVSVEELASIMLELQNFGAASINLVTGTHYIPSIVNSLEIAEAKGLNLPIVWNSSGYETVDALKLIDPYIDLYLLDAKTLSCSTASKFCGLERYASEIVPVMKFLKRRHSFTNLDGRVNGVLIRHLVFPGEIESTIDFINWFAENFKDNFKLSLMTQFVPPKENPGFKPLTKNEYQTLVSLVEKLDIDGFVQEQSDNEILWIPDFNLDQPFPEGFAKPLPFFLKLKAGR